MNIKYISGMDSESESEVNIGEEDNTIASDAAGSSLSKRTKKGAATYGKTYDSSWETIYTIRAVIGKVFFASLETEFLAAHIKLKQMLGSIATIKETVKY